MISETFGLAFTAEEGAYLSSYMDGRIASQAEGVSNCAAITAVIEKFKPLPVALMEVIRLATNGKTETDDLVQAAQEDPALVAEVMKAVNSSAYGISKKVANFKLAVGLLGFNEICRLATRAALGRTLPEDGALRTRLNEIQGHSLAVSRNVADLATAAHLENGSAYSLAAMLHAMGDVLIGMLEQANPRIGALFGLVPPGPLGARLLMHWGLPARLVDLVRHQEMPLYTAPEALPVETAKGLSLLALADLCDQYLLGAEEAKLPTGLVARHAVALGLPEDTVRGIVNKVLLPALSKKRYRIESPLLTP